MSKPALALTLPLKVTWPRPAWVKVPSPNKVKLGLTVLLPKETDSSPLVVVIVR